MWANYVILTDSPNRFDLSFHGSRRSRSMTQSWPTKWSPTRTAAVWVLLAAKDSKGPIWTFCAEPQRCSASPAAARKSAVEIMTKGPGYESGRRTFYRNGADSRKRNLVFKRSSINRSSADWEKTNTCQAKEGSVLEGIQVFFFQALHVALLLDCTAWGWFKLTMKTLFLK